MESIVQEGLIAGVLDITTTEWADELVGGVLAAGPKRLEAAARSGVPAIVTPACLDMVNFWARETVPEKFRDRNLYRHNENVTLMRTTVDECRQIVDTLAEIRGEIEKLRQYRSSNYGASVDLFERLVAMENASPEAIKHLADLYLVLERDDDAERQYRHFLELGRETWLARKQLKEELATETGNEISLQEARQLRDDVEIGMILETPYDTAEAPLTRIAAQAAKQVIYQKVKEAERELVWHEYSDRIGELLTGQVKRFDRGDMVVDLGRTEGVIVRREQSRAEHYNPGDRIRAVLVNVERQGKGPQLHLSRASELLVKKLFEMEVPEIYDETVQIVAVARDAGERSKVAVRSRDRDVDAVGACVGMRGSRVQAVSNELAGERVDIILWDDNPAQFVVNAMSPAEVTSIVIDEESGTMDIAVPEDKLSQAIGRGGQNIKLASQLTGFSSSLDSSVSLF